MWISGNGTAGGALLDLHPTSQGGKRPPRGFRVESTDVWGFARTRAMRDISDIETPDDPSTEPELSAQTLSADVHWGTAWHSPILFARVQSASFRPGPRAR